MKFGDEASKFIPSKVYKRFLEVRLTYLEENIASAFNLAKVTKDEYRKRKYEEYACGQIEMLTNIVEAVVR